MKRLGVLTIAALFLAGCGGNSGGTGETPARFTGEFVGPWVNTGDATDSGKADYTFNADGTMSGTEYGPSGAVSGHIVGKIDGLGNFTSRLTEATEASVFNGELSFDSAGNLTGILVWSGPPIIPYRYTLTRRRLF